MKKNEQKIVTCLNCGTENTTNRSSKEWLYFECLECGNEIGEHIPDHLHVQEGIHFLKNNALLLAIPILSGYCFDLYPEWRIISGLAFCFSLTILSVAYHEFFHAITAYCLGDYTMYGRGYLRLNILRYFNNFTSLVMPLGLFAFYGVFLPGAAVYISLKHIPNPLYRSLVYLSGPLANALILLLLVCLLKFETHLITSTFVPLIHALAFIQIAMIIFNLIPIPGLDGWGAISPILNPNIRAFFEKFGFIFIVGAVASMILINDVSELVGYVLNLSIESVGLDWDQILEGWSYLKIVDDGDCKICSFLSSL